MIRKYDNPESDGVLPLDDGPESDGVLPLDDGVVEPFFRIDEGGQGYRRGVLVAAPGPYGMKPPPEPLRGPDGGVEPLRLAQGPLETQEMAAATRPMQMSPGVEMADLPVFQAAARETEAEVAARARNAQRNELRSRIAGTESAEMRQSLIGKLQGLEATLTPEERKSEARQAEAVQFTEALPAYMVMPGVGPKAGLAAKVFSSGARMAATGAVQGSTTGDPLEGAISGFFTGAGLGVAGGLPAGFAVPATLVGLTKTRMAQGESLEDAVWGAVAVSIMGQAMKGAETVPLSSDRRMQLSQKGDLPKIREYRNAGVEKVIEAARGGDQVAVRVMIDRARSGDAAMREAMLKVYVQGTASAVAQPVAGSAAPTRTPVAVLPVPGVGPASAVAPATTTARPAGSMPPVMPPAPPPAPAPALRPDGKLAGMEPRTEAGERAQGNMLRDLQSRIDRESTMDAKQRVLDEWKAQNPEAVREIEGDVVVAGRGGREAGRGSYWTSSKSQAGKYARGEGAIGLGVEQTRPGSPQVIARDVSPSAKLFEIDDTPNPSLRDKLMQDSRFAKEWRTNWTQAEPTNKNLWDAAQAARVDIQSMLTDDGYQGAAHRNYVTEDQPQGSRDVSVWDETVLVPQGQGAFTIFRGQRAYSPLTLRPDGKLAGMEAAPAPKGAKAGEALSEAQRKLAAREPITMPEWDMLSDAGMSESEMYDRGWKLKKAKPDRAANRIWYHPDAGTPAPKGAAAAEKVDTIAGRMDLTEFERTGYDPSEVTRQNWIDLQRAERRRLGQPEGGDNQRAPWAEYEEFHRDAVARAVKAGDKVDSRVLADYPDLQPPAPAPNAGTVVRGDAAPDVLALGAARGDVINQFPLSRIKVDADRFQFRLLSGEGGVSGSLKDIKKYDRGRGGVLDVWMDPVDGQTYVVNGHNRIAAALRLGVKAHDVRYINAPTAQEARAYGALINISEGHGTPLDAAKFFRESKYSPEDFAGLDLPVSQRMAQDGFALSRLADEYFARVVRGDLDMNVAVRIGNALPSVADQQVAIREIDRRKGRMPLWMVDEMIDHIRLSPSVQQGSSSMFLPGMEPTQKDIKIAEALWKVHGAINRKLSIDKKLFGRVSSTQAAARLEAEGNKIDTETNKKISAEAAIVQEVFNRLKHSTEMGPVLAKAAEEVYRGGDVQTVVKGTYEVIRAKVYEAIGRAESTAEPRSKPDAGYPDGAGGSGKDTEGAAGEVREAAIRDVEGQGSLGIGPAPLVKSQFRQTLESFSDRIPKASKVESVNDLVHNEARRSVQGILSALNDGRITEDQAQSQFNEVQVRMAAALSAEQAKQNASTAAARESGQGDLPGVPPAAGNELFSGRGGYVQGPGGLRLRPPSPPPDPGLSVDDQQRLFKAELSALEQARDEALAKLRAPPNAPDDLKADLAAARKEVRDQFTAESREMEKAHLDSLYASPAAAALSAQATGQVPTAFGKSLSAVRHELGRLFSQMHGLGPKVGRAAEDMRDQKEAAAILGKYFRASVLKDDHGRPLFKPNQAAQVLELAQQSQDGVISLADMAAQLRIPMSHPTIRALEEQAAHRAAFRKAMDQYTQSWPAALRKTLLENQTYMTRFYERWIMGGGYFEPKPEDVQAAITAVSRQMADSVQRTLGRLGRISGPRSQFDVYEFMETGDRSLIAHLHPVRQARALALRREFQQVKDLIAWQPNADPKSAMANVRALHTASAGQVDYWLKRPGEESGRSREAEGGLSMANLQRRVLSDVFRILYKEVGDAGFRAQRTAEVQGDMLARAVFMQRVAEDGENVVWVNHRQPGDKFDIKLGDTSLDRIKYGPLAGKWISKSMQDVLEAPKRHHVALRAYSSLLSYTRLSKVLQLRTAVRNYLTNYEYAVLSGDIFLETYASRLGEAHKLMVGYAAGKPWAIKEVSRLAQLGAFRPSSSTATMDLEENLAGAAMQGRAAMQKVARSYSFIDAMTKWAAFQARVDDGMLPEQAREHVRRHYQNRDRVTGAVQKVTRAGGPDYLGFTTDSVRLMGEGARAAADGVKAGDYRPLLGNMLFYGIRAALISASTMGAGKMLKDLWSRAHRRMRGKQDEHEIEDVQAYQIGAMRGFLPDYDSAAPLWVWQERDKSGKPNAILVTTMSGQTALPMMDWVQGSIQTAQQGGSFREAAYRHLIEAAGKPAMALEFAWKAGTGKTFSGRNANETGKGIWDMINNSDDPEFKKIRRGVGMTALADLAPFGLAQPISRMQRMEDKESSGQHRGGLFERSTNMQDVMWSPLRYLRTARIERGDFQAMFRDRVRQPIENLRSASGIVRAPERAKWLKGAATEQQKADAASVDEMKYALQIRSIVEEARTAFPKEWTGDIDMVLMLGELGMSEDAIHTVLSDRTNMLKTPKPPVDKRELMLEMMYRKR